MSCYCPPSLYASSSTDDGSQRRVVKNQGEDVFAKLALPQAILRFKQGFGRLIRTSTDTGTVFVLDRRLTSSSYGKHFYNQSPMSRSMKDPLEELLEQLKERPTE